MKRVLYYFVAILLVSALFHSCGGGDDPFDESLLIGKWRSGTEYWVYERGYTGYTWDEKDETEEEAKVDHRFTWQLDKTELQQYHKYVGGDLPKFYTVTELTATTLKYKNASRSYSFTKVDN